MKLKFEKNLPEAKDRILIEPNGTVFISFMKTGYIKAMSRVRFESGQSASTGAFSLSVGMSKDDAHEGDEQALHALVFVSEVDGNEKISIVERFRTREEANAAWALLQRALQLHINRQRGVSAWQKAIRYVGGPILVFIVAMSVVRYLDSHNGALEALNALVRASQAVAPSQPAAALASPAEAAALQMPQNIAPAPAASTSELSSTGPFHGDIANAPNPLLSDGASPALNSATAPPATQLEAAIETTTIHFGLDNQSPQKTLFVYSDPNCPACKRFEPHINDLAKDFSIYVLPVAFKDGSAKVAAQVLCATDRKQKWTEVMSRAQATDSVNGDTCARAYGGIKANMQQFDSLGFSSTPRVVNGAGFVFSEGATASAIRAQSNGKHG